MPVRLQPLDVLMVLKLAASPELAASYEELGRTLGVSASQAYTAVRRAQEARLLSQSRQVRRASTYDMLAYGVPYFIPTKEGAESRGMATSFGVEPLKGLLGMTDPPPVWPIAGGSARGPSIEPIYRTAPLAAQQDAKLYSLLAIVDAIRIGRAREKNMGRQQLEDFFGVGE